VGPAVAIVDPPPAVGQVFAEMSTCDGRHDTARLIMLESMVMISSLDRLAWY